jgi:hypothetical protein
MPLIKVASGTRDNGMLYSATQLLGPMPSELLEHWKPEDRKVYVNDQGKALDTIWHTRLPLIDQVFVHLPTSMSITELYCFYDFIRVAVQWRPEDRWSVDELLRHKWVTLYLTCSEKVEDYDWSMLWEGKWGENADNVAELQKAEIHRVKVQQARLQTEKAERQKGELQKAELEKEHLQKVTSLKADLEKVDIQKDVSNLEK